MTNICTINTDASYHPDHKIGAFAFWIVYQGQRLIQSGPLKKPNGPNDAECMAIANALYALLKTDAFKGIKMVIVNTDSKNAIRSIRDGGACKGAETSIKKAKEIIKLLRKKYDTPPDKSRRMPFIDFRHVKGHTKGETARLWVNNWLDRAAKTAMREQITKP